MPTPTTTTAEIFRRFELCNEKHNKFWEIHHSGTKVTTIYGRIGSIGAMTTKEFSGRNTAVNFYENIVYEKERKGYQEVQVVR